MTAEPPPVTRVYRCRIQTSVILHCRPRFISNSSPISLHDFGPCIAQGYGAVPYRRGSCLAVKAEVALTFKLEALPHLSFGQARLQTAVGEGVQRVGIDVVQKAAPLSASPQRDRLC